MLVQLTWAEMSIATNVAIMRQLSAMRLGRVENHGASGLGFERHIIGAQSEMAVAKMLNVYWNGTVGEIHLPDMNGNVEVRSTLHPTGDLILHPTDKDDSIFYLVRAAPPIFDIVGWIKGCDGKRKDFWTSRTTPPRPAFFVPWMALTRINETAA